MSTNTKRKIKIFVLFVKNKSQKALETGHHTG